MSENLKNPYIGDYLINKEQFYIHKHLECVGKAKNKESMNDSELADLFMKRRRQVIRTSKTIYKNLLKTKMNDETKELLKESSDINEEKLIKNLNQSIGKYLNKNLDSTLDKLSALRKIHQSVKIEKIFEDKTLNTWNNLLEALAEASKLLGTKGEPIVKAIIASEQDGGKTANIQQYGKKLYDEIQKLSNGNFLQINPDLEGIVGILNTLALNFSEKKTRSGESLSESNLSIILNQNVFSKEFAEYLTSRITTTAENGVQKILIGELTGKNKMKAAVYDDQGKKIDEIDKFSDGKTDVSFKDFKISLFDKQTNKNLNITLDLGLSVKFYKNKKWFSKEEQNNINNVFSAGSGGTLNNALFSVFPNGKRNMQLAYNVIARNNSFSKSYQVLSNLIIARQINSFFSSRNEEDFSLFLFANGQLISIWDIISQVSNFEQSLVTLSFPEASKAVEKTKEKNSQERSRQINELLSDATVKAEIHTKQLKSSLF